MDNYLDSLKLWNENEKAANEFINIVGKLWYDKSVELILLRSLLVNRGSGKILNKHLRAEAVLGKPVRVQDSLLIAKAMLAENLAPARIDIGRLNSEWTDEHEKYHNNVSEFVRDKLSYIIDAAPRSNKVQDVILYGFGRIGRILCREMTEMAGNGTTLRVRAIVTRKNSPEDIAKRISLFRTDSVHGYFHGVCRPLIEENAMMVNGQKILFLEGKNPEDLDYEQYGIHDALLIDNTGAFRDRESLSRHLQAKGVAKVLLTAPGKGDIPNVVYGVNQDTLDLKNEKIFSAASCTTNAIVPGLQVMLNHFGIVKGHIETIHSYTNDQNLLDNYHKKERRGRSAALNMVITETGAGKAAAKALPELKGKLTSNAVRVPTPDVSLAVLALDLERETTVEEVNEAFRIACLEGNLIEQIRFSQNTEFVSSDGIGDSCACIFDAPATKISADGKTVILYLWYDNEFGYSNQVIRLARHIGEVKSYRYY